MSSAEVRVLQVNNISPSATKDQLQSLFSYVGRIEECRVRFLFNNNNLSS